MKKIILTTSILFIGACSNNYYSYQMWNGFYEEKPQKKTVKFIGDDESAAKYLLVFFEKYGLKFVGSNTNKKTDYLATIKYSLDAHHGYRNVPIYGRTGINSINTNTYGTYSPGLSYGSINYSGTSHSTVNYDYGITGWQTMPYTSYTTSMIFSIKKYSPKTQIENMPAKYQSSLYIQGPIHRFDMLNNLVTATKNFGLQKDREYKMLDCYYDEYNDQNICEEPQGFFSRIVNSFKSE